MERVLTIELDDDLYAHVERLAEESKLSVNELLIMALQGYLERREIRSTRDVQHEPYANFSNEEAAEQ